MTQIRQSVAGVVVFSHFFLHDHADAQKCAQFGIQINSALSVPFTRGELLTSSENKLAVNCSTIENVKMATAEQIKKVSLWQVGGRWLVYYTKRR